MKSKRDLFKDLAVLAPGRFADEAGIKRSRYVGHENYGKTSCIYLSWPNGDERDRMEAELAKRGHEVNFNYARAMAFSEVEVDYFSDGALWDD